MGRKRNAIKDTGEYARIYSALCGMNHAELDEDGEKRFLLLENMVPDATGTGIQSIPGYRKLGDLGSKIYGIYPHKLSSGEDMVYVHVDNALYSLTVNDKTGKMENLTYLAKMGQVKSHAYNFGQEMFIMDGNKITGIDDAGGVFEVGKGYDAVPYVPTTYRNGKPFEDRNLLTPYFSEEVLIDDVRNYIYATPGLCYSIIDRDARTCRVTGIEGVTDYYELVIPSRVNLGGETYDVVEIADYAFARQEYLSTLRTNPNLKKIGSHAFDACMNLIYIALGSDVEIVEDHAFTGCIYKLIIGRGLKEVGTDAFSGLQANAEVNIAGSPSDYPGIDFSTLLPDYVSVKYNHKYEEVQIGVKVLTPHHIVKQVLIDGVNTYFDYFSDQKTIWIMGKDRLDFEGKLITILGTHNELPDYNDTLGVDFLSTDASFNVNTSAGAILGCMCSATFDGRIFLSGHPMLPGVVFYSAKTRYGTYNPLYFGARCYFTDGLGSYEVTSLLAVNDAIGVFRRRGDEEGSITYHTIDRGAANDYLRYPANYTHANISTRGGTCLFLDEPVFLSSEGLCSPERMTGVSERHVALRSSAINSLLLKEDLSRAVMTVWGSMLCICINGHLYLADYRSRYKKGGTSEYEWYYVSGVGNYLNDEEVYRYSDTAEDGYTVHKSPGTRAEGTVVSLSVGDEEIYYVAGDGGVKYRVYPTVERRGGSFSPATCIAADEERLFFGTNDGSLFVFNNDMIGIAPDLVKKTDGYDEADYEQAMGDKLHPYFYSFAEHAPVYTVTLRSDDCDLPYLTKSTVAGSTVVKLKSLGAHSVDYVARTERGEHREKISLEGAENKYLPITVSSRERGWVEKEITLTTDEFCSPFGIASVSYRYKIKGKPKRSTAWEI